MEKEKKTPAETEKQTEDPVLFALQFRWIELPSGIFVPEK